MKIIFSILLIASGIVGWSQQTANIPENALADFNSKFKAEDNVAISSSWESVENGFKVTYSTDTQSGIIFYDDKGIVKSTMDEVQFDFLPEKVRIYIDNHYSIKKVQKSYFLNSDTAPERAVVVVKTKKGVKTVYFRPDGTYHYEE